MTHTEWENGKELAIHNATKEQLKFMVKDRDNRITELQKELENKQKALNEAMELLKTQLK
jgi:Skp family chaperone for outer membrane proteins